MSETLALLRIAIASSRLLLSVLLISLCLAEASALLTMMVGPDFGGGAALAALYCVLLPSFVASIVLFDYRDNGDMNLPESGCSHWLLRMPIHAWKIAIVPVILRTLWVFGLWIMVLLVARQFEFTGEIPLIGPPICLAAVAVWVLVIAWRPFRSGWRRLAAIALAIPILYCCVGATFVAANINQVEWRPIAIPVSIVLAVALYLAGVWVAIRSVALARTCTMGIIPAQGRGAEGDVLSTADESVRFYRNARHALVHHDWIKSRLMIRRVLVAFVIPSIIGATLFLPLHIVALIMVLVGFAEFAAVAAWSGASTAPGSQGFPPYLAASPLRSSTIAWSRTVAMLIIGAAIYCCVLFIFAGWACWPENRQIWSRWAADRLAELDGSSLSATNVGVRWSLVIVFAWATFFLSRLVAYLWIVLSGRTWLSILMTVVSGLVYLTPVGVGLRWFMVQTDWESTRISALSYLPLVPLVVAGLLVLKVVALITSIIAVTKKGLARRSEVGRIVVIWTLITLMVSGSIAMLVPDPRVTFAWCLAVTTLMIPLSRVIALPLALAWDRHR
jgi:hypothetical protein